MNKLSQKLNMRLRFVIVSVYLMTIAWAPVCAFQSGRFQTFTMTASVGTLGDDPPTPSSDLQINHQALLGISQVTRMAIVQGQVGRNPSDAPVAFPQRITSQEDVAASQVSEIEIFIQYRFIPPGTPDIHNIPFIDSQPIVGPDPMAFAFQIEPNVINFGVMEYRIIAKRLPDGEPVNHPIDDEVIRVGVESSASNVVGRAGGRVVVEDGNPNDGKVALEIPANILPGPTVVTLNEVPTNSPVVPPIRGIPDPVAVYRLDSDNPLNNNLKVTLLYPDFTFPSGQDGIIDGTQIPEHQTSIVWWDGFDWRRVRGRTDPTANTVTAAVGLFQFLAVVPMGPAAAAEYKPARKIITPNGDGINDTAVFTFGDGSETASVKIFDVNGNRIREITMAGNPEWNGRDSSGKIVESGVYIYQYELNGERVSGLIAVAK